MALTNGSIGFRMQMFIANILELCSRAESLENSLILAKPAWRILKSLTNLN
jgi:hypothetical protein